MYIFIDNTNRTADYIRYSLKIRDELRETVNEAEFRMSNVAYLSEFADVKIFDGCPIVSLSGTALVIAEDYSKTNLLRAGTELWLGLGEATEEKVTVASVSGTAVTLSAAAVSAHAAAQLCGVKKFAGVIISFEDENIDVLENLEFTVTCADYTKILDKKLVNDSWEDKDARYIINEACNDTINKNALIDQMDYADDAAIQAEWVDSNDADNPTVTATDPYESTKWGVFPWTHSGTGYGYWTATPVSQDISGFTGVASGQPTKGKIGFWLKFTDYTTVSAFRISFGSDSSNLIYKDFTPTSNSAQYILLDLADMTMTGTPVWTAFDHILFKVTETASSSLQVAGFRILEDQCFNHYPYVESSYTFDNFNVDRVKPTEMIERLADELHRYWYIDYEKNIHFFEDTTNTAPFDLTATSDNFSDLSLSWDTSRLINRQIVKGSEDISTSTYSEAREGDGIIREWILKSKFKNLIVEVDKNTSTLTAEAGTTTTTINATGHGLLAGDYIVNRTRSNAVREILTVATDSFTVATVTGQVATDTISKFTAQVIGIEGIDDESACDYMYNYNEKSIRNASGEVTLLAGEFIVFKYNEVLTILVQRKENASVAALISKLGWSDGIVDGQPIVDKTIKTRTEALATANAELQKYANMVIKATFKTNQEGLKAGQMIKITDATTNRNIDQYFLIQKVIMVQKAELLNEYTITAASALFGIEDFFQKVLKAGRKLDVNADAIIENVEDVYSTCGVHDVWSSAVDPNIAEANCGVNDSWTSLVTTPPFRWGVTVNNPIIWDFFTWG